MFTVLSITGAIGSGKSTVIKKLKERVGNCNALPYDVIFADEPIEQWESQGWLTRFYNDKKRWSFSFQMKVLQGQIELYQKFSNASYQKPTILVTERSPLDGLHIFCDMLTNKEKCMDENERQLFEWYVEHIAWIPPHVVWVDTSCDICVDRIKSRDRNAEQSVDIEYFKKITDQYTEKMGQIANRDLYSRTVENFLRLDNNVDDLNHVNILGDQVQLLFKQITDQYNKLTCITL